MATTARLRLDHVIVERPDAGGRQLAILDIADLDVEPGTALGVSGPSGAGKSTFLEIVSGISPPRRGTVAWGDTVVSNLTEGRRERWRRETVGFIFQEFHLIPELSALENVLLPARFGGVGVAGALKARAQDLLTRVGLTDPRRAAAVLSRGEQQRVAIARALLLQPALILADEPTASLDGETAAEVADLIVSVAREAGASLIVVSHDGAVLARLDRRIHLRAGRIAEPRPGDAA
jgi:putative ABC transport system ATP-binding protein